MSEFIDRIAFINELEKICGCATICTRECIDCEINVIKGMLRSIPAADVAPVVHSKWEICSDGYYPYCKRCRNEPQGRVMTKFCPKCGAKMDEEEQNGNV